MRVATDDRTARAGFALLVPEVVVFVVCIVVVYFCFGGR